MWFLYILKCKDNSLYTGITTDVERRVNMHNNKKGSRAIRGKLPAKLVYTEKHPSHSKALKREAEIKAWPRPKKLLLIQN